MATQKDQNFKKLSCCRNTLLETISKNGWNESIFMASENEWVKQVEGEEDLPGIREETGITNRCTLSFKTGNMSTSLFLPLGTASLLILHIHQVLCFLPTSIIVEFIVVLTLSEGLLQIVSVVTTVYSYQELLYTDQIGNQFYFQQQALYVSKFKKN